MKQSSYLLLKSSGLELDFPILTLVLKQLFPFKNLFKTLLSRSSQRVPPTRCGPPLNKIRVSPQLINPPLPKPWVNPKAYHRSVSYHKLMYPNPHEAHGFPTGPLCGIYVCENKYE